MVDRIFEYITYKDLSYSEFDKSIGAANGYIGKQIKKGGNLGSHIIEKIIYKYNDINPIWLITGNGEMIFDKNINNYKYNKNEVVEKKFDIVNLSISTLNSIIDSFDLKKEDLGSNEGIFVLDQEKNSLIYNYNRDKYLCIKYKGKRVNSNIKYGTYLIIKNLTSLKFDQLNSNSTFVIFTMVQTYIGSLEYNINDPFLHIKLDDSDGNEKSKTIRVDIDEIISIWNVIGYLNADESAYEPAFEIDSMESIKDQIVYMQEKLESLKLQIAGDKVKS